MAWTGMVRWLLVALLVSGCVRYRAGHIDTTDTSDTADTAAVTDSDTDVPETAVPVDSAVDTAGTTDTAPAR